MSLNSKFFPYMGHGARRSGLSGGIFALSRSCLPHALQTSIFFYQQWWDLLGGCLHNSFAASIGCQYLIDICRMPAQKILSSSSSAENSSGSYFSSRAILLGPRDINAVREDDKVFCQLISQSVSIFIILSHISSPCMARLFRHWGFQLLRCGNGTFYKMHISLWAFLISLLLAFYLKDAMSLLNTRLPSVLPKVIKSSSLPIIRTPSLTSRILPSPNNIPPTSRPFSHSAHNMSPAVKMIGPAQPFLDTMAARRTIYTLNKEIPIPQSRIEEIIEHAILHVPSCFNSQSTRIVMLVGDEHDKLWGIVKESVKAVAPPEAWPTSEKKLNGFKAGYGTVRHPPAPTPSRVTPRPFRAIGICWLTQY